MTARREAQPYMNPYLAGALLGVVLFLAYFLTGTGLGASGGMARILAAMEDLILPAHMNSSGYLSGLAGGDTNALDHWIVPLTGGTLLGGFVSALFAGRAKLETQRGPGISVRARWGFAVLGGLFMGFGARMARGCTSGQALSGGAVLSLGSWAFMFAVFAGGYAVAYFVRRLWV